MTLSSVTMHTVAVLLLPFLLTQVSCQRVWVLTKKVPSTLATGSSSVYKSDGLSITSDLAVDGSDETDFHLGGCFASAEGDTTPMWYVDLGRSYHVHSVDILNRGDCCEDQLSNVIIDVTENNPLTGVEGKNTHCGIIAPGVPADTHVTTVCLYHIVKTQHWYKAMFPQGRYVKIQKGMESLTLCEVEVRVVSETRNNNPEKRSAEFDIQVIDVPRPIRLT